MFDVSAPFRSLLGSIPSSFHPFALPFLPPCIHIFFASCFQTCFPSSLDNFSIFPYVPAPIHPFLPSPPRAVQDRIEDVAQIFYLSWLRFGTLVGRFWQHVGSMLASFFVDSGGRPLLVRPLFAHLWGRSLLVFILAFFPSFLNPCIYVSLHPFIH